MVYRSAALVGLILATLALPDGASAGGFAGAAQRGAVRGLSRTLTRSVERGSLGSFPAKQSLRSLERSRLRNVTRLDLLNHERSRIISAPTSRQVFRFTTRARALRETKLGVGPGRHMSANAGPGRPLSAQSAKRRFGLPQKPEVRETIRIPRGQPIRLSPVAGGLPGVREITSPKRLPPAAVIKLVPVH